MIDAVSSGKKGPPLLETGGNTNEESGRVMVRNVSSASAGSHESSNSLIHYGDLELFLISIQLGSLVSLFQVLCVMCVCVWCMSVCVSVFSVVCVCVWCVRVIFVVCSVCLSI